MLYSPYNIVGLIISVLDILAIINVINSRSATDRKILWTLLILFLPLLGLILYYLMGKNKQDAILH